MSRDTRRKDVTWDVTGGDGKVSSWEQAHAALLMDIRDELKKLNSLLHCHNFQAIPRKLDRISRNTAKPRKKKYVRLKVVS